MWKPLVVLAIVASSLLITPSEGTKIRPHPDISKPHRRCSKPNEVFDQCPNPCPPRECDFDETVVLCPPPPKPGSPQCKPGCRCADGYLRDSAGICIPEDECEYDCARNETLDSCVSDCPPRYCGVNIAAVSCLAINEDDCELGCRCKDGYLRNAEGDCILEKDCPRCSKPNEVYDICVASCPSRLCGVDETLIDCKPPPRPGDPECQAGCRCADGFLRNPEGICVTEDQCPRCSKPNEVYDICVAPCPPRLCGVDETIDCAPPPNPGDPECQAGCRCADGFLRNPEGICVPEDQCTTCKGRNEVYDVCPNPCPPQRCDVDPRVIRCAAPPEPGDADCEPGCRCIGGLVRNEKGICVERSQCVSCGGDFNAEPGCDQNCTRRCPGPKPAECKCFKGGCRCKDGFLYDPTIYKCVRPEECASPCGDNEVLSNCSNGGCGPWRCTDVGIPTGCVKMDPKYCIVDCVCKENYVRDENEVCIPAIDCPECGGDPNAVYGCGINCGRLCSNYKTKNVSCIAECQRNACDCRKGFVLDENTNKCVRPKDCTPVCGKNEVFSECINGGCQAKNCSQIGEPVPCVKPAKCIQGCLCAEGYLRDVNGVCIPKEQCPPKCTGVNEIYDPCPPTCPPQVCESINKTYFCPLMPNNKTKACRGECRCIPNFYRNKKGVCISAKNCLKCTGPNEYFACGGACDNVCATLSKQNQTNCPIINIKCNEKCYCDEGYARDKNNICIPIDQCPGKCGENERWEECPAKLCSPQSCDDLGFEVDCDTSENTTCPGPPGCVCDYNFVRDENGKCIPERECPSCGGDPNAQSGCGLNCGRLCSNYNQGPVPCPRICLPNACDCKPDFVFDENREICVLPKDCTPTCKEHEVYSECTNGGCQARNCSQLGKPVPCVKLDPKSCIKGCVCEEGYLRLRNGTCVPENKCDNCNKPHEHYEPCARSCPPETCESIGRKYKCLAKPAVCKGACRCDKGYYRNKIGQCIRKRDCLKCKGPHEYFSCGGACDNVCATLYKQNQTNCPIRNIKCNEMCYCEKGYARNKNNICIPIEKCPKPRCGVNERLEECPPAMCAPQECSELGFPKTCPDFFLGCPVPPSCVCIDGYVRNSRGRCIPRQRCPSCGGDPNAVSGCGVNCGRTCSTYKKKNISCIEICDINGCDCRKGFVLDENLDKCVRPKDCTPTCPKNEVYDSCANGGCGKWNCSQLGQPDLCIDPLECKGGCICQKGYLRTENGTCVPINQCPAPDCEENERFVWCPDTLCEPQTCSQLGFPVVCPVLGSDSSCPGEPACICENGYVRNVNGDCIPKKQCPSCGGDPNAVSGCGVNCGRLCSNYNKGPVPCPKICRVNACDCKKDYVFDSNTKKCVRPKDCTPVCGNDEVYSECINGGCQRKNCSQLGKPVPCIKIDPKYCKKGCLCKEGYLRDSNGVCIPQEKCPENCFGSNEVYDSCPPICPPQTCESINKTYHCPLIRTDSKLCRPACRCKDGYYRNKIGECISEAECQKCTGLHEYYSCGGACDNVCETLDKQNQTNCPIINIKCNEMCYCEEGYARDKNNTCIPIDQCPQNCFGSNEVYDPCPPICPPQTCESIGKVYPCPLVNPDSKYCEPACRCKGGYYRNKINQCISEADCQKCTGPHEFFSCGGACDNVCETLNIQNQTNCPIINIKCNEMCYCEEGYARDKNNTCIPIDQCPPPTCGENERLDDCPDQLCVPKSCSDVGFPLDCLGDDSSSTSCACEPGCVCIENYVRDDNGKCIPIQECPSCGGDSNAVSGCGINCGRLCSNYNQTDVACILLCKINGCDCKEDYVYDSNIDKCVLPEDCTPTCGKNEMYDICANGGCQKRNCTQVGQPTLCIDPVKCIVGCVCMEGFLRNKDGDCVPEDQCPLQCTTPHEVYDPCPPPCPPQLCTVIIIGLAIPCVPPPPPGSEFCSPACRCENGYYRNSIDECISKSDCLKCTGPNEYFSCGPACDNVCATLSTQNKTNCPIKNKKCNNKCYCNEGYARDDNNICIPIDQCGVSCNGDLNATSGCGGYCGRRCSNYNKGPVACPLSCQLGACDCKEGYVYDDILEKCVLPKDCTPASTCGENEMYDICANGGCQKRNCSQLGEMMLCLDPIKCIGGCVCKEGFLRNDDGDCVPENQCPLQCTNPHEVYDPCPRTCPPQICAAIGLAYPCPRPPEGEEFCNPACRCEYGYYRNSIDECISESDCLKCTGLNEYFSCGPACDNVCATLSTQNKTNCPIINIKCNDKCYCNDGYARDDNNICIPIDQCGVSCNGDPNAIEGCGGYCGRRCSDYNKGPVACPLICRLGACDCKQGYVYDDNLEKCVLPEDCTPICGEDEVYSACINGGCDKKLCSDLGRPKICINPFKCYQGCVCKKGFLRDENGTCVPIDKCPTPVCKKNEVYDSCANGGCGRRKCSELSGPIICIDPIECIGDCVCAEGYLRDEDGVCVPICQCNPQCNQPHEVFKLCPSTCPPQTCESLDRAYICPIETGQEPPCEPGCVCEDTYFRNKIGECISEEDCLKCMGPHEYYSCGVACDNVCETLNEQSQDNCPIINVKCNEMCYCERGYARNASNICIPIEDCSPPVCKKNEVYDSCANGGCGRRKCSELSDPIICIDPIECIGDCVCAEGYLRDEDGVCVPICQCNPQCNQPHEVFKLCPSTCPPQTCESLDRAYICPIETGQEPPCEPGCVCEDTYFRNKIGECISEEDCLKCMGPHEYYSCGGACDNVCETLNEQSQDDCPIINIKCNEMCYCERGYARNASNICIPIEDCPPSRCGPDERYEESPCRVCEPLTCCEVGMPMDCPPVENDDCQDTPACICKYGLVRNEDNVCIPISECPSENAVNVTEARARLDDGSIALSGKFLYYLASTKPDENIVASATSLLIPLAQLSLFAVKGVLQELLTLLNLNNKDEVRAVFPKVTDEYENQEKVEFEVASKYYANKNYPLSEKFKSDSKKIFKSEGENIDFSQNDKAAKTINKWVENRTRDKIKDLVSADMFSDDTRLCLVNAIYFLGNWVHQFDPKNTKEKDFHKSNGEIVSKKIMYQQNTFNYGENDQYQVLEMPYKNENCSFVVVLPKNKQDLLRTLKSIEDPAVFNAMIKNLSPQKVKVYLPVMLINTKIDLKDVLIKNNVSKMFDSNNNGFEGILEKPEPIYISDALQKAFISVNELGTEAAAATAITVTTTSLQYPPPKIYMFEATHPFIFYILLDKVPLFCGLFVGA